MEVCHQCKKKAFFLYTCRCELLFCKKHKAEDKHQCTFDYKEAAKKEMKNKIVKFDKFKNRI